MENISRLNGHSIRHIRVQSRHKTRSKTVRVYSMSVWIFSVYNDTSKIVRKASRVLNKTITKSINQKFTNNRVHILPEQIHRLAFKSVLVIPETYPEFPCEGVRKHQHSAVTLAGTSG